VAPVRRLICRPSISPPHTRHPRDRQAAKAFKASKVDKGIAFPTCVSVNECVGNHSPSKGDGGVIKAGDAVKM
jgi:methionine aminopeptidase